MTSLNLIITSTKRLFIWRTLFSLSSEWNLPWKATKISKSQQEKTNKKKTHPWQVSKSSSDNMMWMVGTCSSNLFSIWVQSLFIKSGFQYNYNFPNGLETALWKHPPNYTIQEQYFYNFQCLETSKVSRWQHVSTAAAIEMTEHTKNVDIQVNLCSLKAPNQIRVTFCPLLMEWALDWFPHDIKMTRLALMSWLSTEIFTQPPKMSENKKAWFLFQCWNAFSWPTSPSYRKIIEGTSYSYSQ